MNVASPNTYHCCSTLDELPSNTKYFKNFFVEDSIKVCDAREEVKTILSIKSNIIVNKVTLCENNIEFKADDKVKSGSLLKLDLKISFQIKYVGGKDKRSVFVENDNFYKIIYIPVPTIINGHLVKDLYRRNKINAQVFVEDLQTNNYDNKIIKFSLLALTNILFIT